MTFHRVDSSLIKSPSVGVPWRMVIVALVLVLVGLAGFGSMELVPASAVADHAVQLLGSDEAMSLQLASDRPSL